MIQVLICTQDWLRGTSLKNDKGREEESDDEEVTVEGSVMCYTCLRFKLNITSTLQRLTVILLFI